MTVRLIEARGTSYDIGRAVGRAVPELVVSAVARICRLDVPAATVSARLTEIEAALASSFPHVLEEANGLAEGARIDRRDALLLSVASDVHGKLPGWCSLGAVPGPDGTLVGKNLDQSPDLAPLQVVEFIARDGDYAYVHLTTAGAMWTDGGVNERGLALVNASIEASGADPVGVPDGILVRELLARCADVREAVELATSQGVRTLGENVLVADADGRSAVIELLPGGHAVREGFSIVACNHPLVADLVPLASPADPIRGNSERRTQRLTDLAAVRQSWTIDEMAEALADHDGGICQHGQEGLWTIASLVLAPRSRRMWFASGPPCRNRFEEVELSERLGELGAREQGSHNLGVT
jgi:hypothetical protein